MKFATGSRMFRVDVKGMAGASGAIKRKHIYTDKL
jgi:hypothetical protein